MADLQFLVLTKFNCRSTANWTRKALDKDWLKARFKLFDEFCLPSITGQSDQSFLWTIFFDDETPEPFFSRARQLAEISNIKPIFTPPPDRLHLRRLLFDCIKVNSGQLITCRLDNDDGLALDYVERLRKVAESAQTDSYFNFRHGVILANNRLYLQDQRDNAFCAYKEDIPTSPEELKTVWNVPHTNILNDGPVIQIAGAPAWLQVVHGANVSNKRRGCRVHPSEIETNFHLNRTGLNSNKGLNFYWERYIMRHAWLIRDRIALSIRKFRR